MSGKGIRILAIAGLLVMAIVAAAMPVEAKTTYWFYDHWAVRYPHNEIASSLQPYVDHIEYDLKYNIGSGCGVRLYMTQAGLQAFKQNQPVLSSVTKAVMAAPEWKQQRTYASVKTEIWMHANWGRTQVDIEYNYMDLKWWEEPYRYI